MEIRFPWDPRPDLSPKATADPTPQPLNTTPVRAGRRTLARYDAIAGATPVDSTCLYAHLTVTGPADDVAQFEQAARGPGVIPWHFDADLLEEDVFLMATQALGRSLTVEGCRILARLFRRRAEERHQKTLALIGHDTRCALDLHALLPIPDAVLRCGASDPKSRAWLHTHWGVGEALRKIVRLPDRTGKRLAAAARRQLRYGFFTDGALPDPAIRALAERWPTLIWALERRDEF